MNIIRYLINMKRHYALLLVALMALTAGTAHAITREQLAQYASSLKGKKKAELKTAEENAEKDLWRTCLLYTSDAAEEEDSVD